MTLSVAEVKALLNDPETLMRKCYLHIAGGATRTPTLPNMPLPPANGQAEIKTFNIEIGHQAAKGFTTGLSGLLGKTKDRTFVKFTKTNYTATPGPNQFNAYYIPMVQTSDVTDNRSHYTLPASGPIELVITSKLSGCTFGVGSNSGDCTMVTHVQPNSAIDKGKRGANLNAAVSLGFDNITAKAAKGSAYQDFAAVMGKRNGSSWSFYLQASTYSDSTYAVSNVTVIA